MTFNKGDRVKVANLDHVLWSQSEREMFEGRVGTLKGTAGQYWEVVLDENPEKYAGWDRFLYRDSELEPENKPLTVPPFEHEVQTVFKVSYSDFSDFVNEFYGFEAIVSPWGSKDYPYNFAAVEECGNDTMHQYTVGGEYTFGEPEEVAKWVESGGTDWIGNYDIFEDLYAKGAIPKGTYLVDVSW